MREEEIRPKEVFDKYLALSQKDALVMQSHSNRFKIVACPACASVRSELWFQKNGFSIQICQSCDSVYCSPRPSFEQLENFYIESESSRFWAKEFFPLVAEARIEKLFKPKARAMADLLKEKNIEPHAICDVGAGHGLLLDQLKNYYHYAKVYAIEPGKELSKICRQKGYEVLEVSAEGAKSWHGQFDLVTCLEVVEHVFSPEGFVRSLYNLLKSQGSVLITGLSGDGFDIQALGRRSKSVHPPHHLNFLSVKGFRKLFERCGFCDIEVSTPGQLDVDIVLNNFENSSCSDDRFIKTLLARGEETQKSFQRFLVKEQLSSHLWVFARRP